MTTLEAIPTPAPAPSPAAAPAVVPTLMPVPGMAPDPQDAPIQAQLPAPIGKAPAASCYMHISMWPSKITLCCGAFPCDRHCAELGVLNIFAIQKRMAPVSTDV